MEFWPILDIFHRLRPHLTLKRPLKHKNMATIYEKCKKKVQITWKNGRFCHYLAMNGKLWVWSFVPIFSARDDQVKFHENRMLGSAKTNLPLLTLTSWVKVASPFARKVFWNRNGKFAKRIILKNNLQFGRKKTNMCNLCKKYDPQRQFLYLQKNGTEWHFANCQKMNRKYPRDYHIPKFNIS